MSCQALTTALELKIQTSVFDCNKEQLECFSEPLISHDITDMSGPPIFSVSQANNPTNSLKGQHLSMIGHGHPSQQGMYVMDSSFHHGMDADKHNNFVERGNMIQLNRCTTDDSSFVGQRCQRLGCNDVVESQTVFCKTHSVGQRCQMLGCPHVVPDGSTLCMSHGGGRPHGELGSSPISCTKSEVSIKYEGDHEFAVMENDGNALGSMGIYNLDVETVMCKHQGCSKRAQGNTTYCKVHSGSSKGCMVQGCTKGAHGGTPLCIGHGGGKRCAVPGCPNAACGSSQGRTDRCVRHGGGKRCRFDGCGKGAQGNTEFCIAHGGGRRCKFEGCGKSAQGRSEYCIKHGGGRRCKFQGCSTSAKWGMDFCSIHRKSVLGGSNSIHDMPPAGPAKRRAKKAKSTVQAPDISSETVPVSAIPGSGMPKMAVIHVGAAASNHEKLPESVMKHATMVGEKAQSTKSSLPSGLTGTAEDEAAARGRALFGL